MIISEKWIHFYFIFSILIGASFFMFGLFPLSYTNNERAGLEDLPEFIDDIPLNKSNYRRHVSRSVLMVIDAMRTDFLQNEQNTSMKYLNKMIKDGTACMVNLNVEVPTVTMPRIKAMTTGTIPNFIDVVMNLGSSELHMDSLLHQIYNKGGKMIFCGDNTWVKMFPEMFHRVSENQDSLYVNDFYEGDKNITKKLSDELKRSDWELLILHFLGLDHIGHVEGPFSSKVPPKLREMDTVALHIQLALMHLMKEKNEDPPLFIITGDHGMRDTGGHGGSTYPEINVPLIFIGPSCSQTDESYNQIDMPATLSVLLGLPIPASSIGSIIPNLLTHIPMEQRLFAYYYNVERLLKKLAAFEHSGGEDYYFHYLMAKNEHKTFLHSVFESEKASDKMKRVFESAEQSYMIASKKMSEKLAGSYINFDLFSIGVGLICLATSLLSLALKLISTTKNVNVSFICAIVLSSIVSLVHQHVNNEPLFQPNIMFFATEVIFFTIVINIQLLLKLISNIEIAKSLELIRSTTKFCKFLTFGILFHGISTLSSSFIEEEHQIWYYLNNTMWIILYVIETRHVLKAKKTNQSKSSETDPSLVLNQINWAVLFIGHLIARRLNQTGDKWLNVPDIGDWLQMEENRTWNSLFVSCSCILTHLVSVDYCSILTNVLTLVGIMLIYYYRTLTGSVYFAGIKATGSTATCILLYWLNIAEVVAINFIPVFFNAIQSKLQRFDIKSLLGTLVILTTLIVALTHKPHNIFLIALLLYSCNRIKKTSSILCKDNSTLSLPVQCVLHLWIGKQFFFYQGNSNSLASIDLNAGYVGLSNFNFIVVGLFLTINTFSGPILSFLAFAHNTYEIQSEGSSPPKDAKKTLPLVILLIAFPFILYVFIILFLRHHLFIWSVFSPKLLYEFYYLCLMYLLWSFITIIMHF